MTDLHIIQGSRPDKEPSTVSFLEVTISARNRHHPHGRVGPFRLTERGLKELAAAAARIERARR